MTDFIAYANQFHAHSYRRSGVALSSDKRVRKLHIIRFDDKQLSN